MFFICTMDIRMTGIRSDMWSVLCEAGLALIRGMRQIYSRMLVSGVAMPNVILYAKIVSFLKTPNPPLTW